MALASESAQPDTPHETGRNKLVFVVIFITLAACTSATGGPDGTAARPKTGMRDRPGGILFAPTKVISTPVLSAFAMFFAWFLRRHGRIGGPGWVRRRSPEP
jgi:hypothetical protein